MRTLPKYVLLSCAAVGVAWAAVSVEVRGRTPYGHFLKAGGDAWVDNAQASWRSAKAAAADQWDALQEGESEAAQAPAPKKPRAPAPARRRDTPKPQPTVQEESGAKRRVALLQAADKKVAPKKEAPRKRRTHVDSPASKADRAALDRLVAGR